MSHVYFQLSLALLFVVGLLEAASTPPEEGDDVDRNSVAPTPTPLHSSNELSTLPGNLLSMIANGGTVAVSLIALAAVTMLIMPLFGLRMCSILGNCDPYQGYYNNDAYNSAAGYGQSSQLYTPSTYQKRSLEYIGPILKALSNAYDKYGRTNSAASVKKS